MRRPGDGLHRSQVLRVLLDREDAGVVPHQELGRGGGRRRMVREEEERTEVMTLRGG